MNQAFAIRADKLCKSFRIHAGAATSLKEILVRGIVMHERIVDYEALKDVSFELPVGQSLAVVGRNGSGKSTLLKLITGITEPSSGNVEVKGRIAALLELSAGFHHDLTGMENIFAQGSITGLSRAQIMERLDAIIEFSELGKFIHTPMKRYSSGMIVRLGFSLAAFSDADILLIDEVLAVGDSSFRQKCLRKIRSLRQAGKTIVFVSHELPQVEAVADNVLWLEKGQVVMQGTLAEVIPEFAGIRAPDQEEKAEEEREAALEIQNRRHRFLMVSNPEGFRAEAKGAVLDSVRMLDASGVPQGTFETGKPATVEIHYSVGEDLPPFDIQVGFGGPNDLPMGWFSANVQGLEVPHNRGHHTLHLEIDALPFRPGRYKLDTALVKSLRDMSFHDLQLGSCFVQITGSWAVENMSLALPPGEFK